MDVKLERKYQMLITELKILAIQEEDRTQAKKYTVLYRQLQKIRERRHLDLVGEKGINKEKYKEILEFIDSNYTPSKESPTSGAKEVCNLLFSHIKEYEKEM